MHKQENQKMYICLQYYNKTVPLSIVHIVLLLHHISQNKCAKLYK